MVALGTGLLEDLVLVLDALDLALDFFLPVVVQGDLTLLVVGFKLTNFLELGLLFNLEQRLFDGLGQEHVQDGLNLALIVEEVEIFDLSDFVNASFLRTYLGEGGLGIKTSVWHLTSVSSGVLRPCSVRK